MAQDFAKRKKNTGSRKSAGRRQPTGNPSRGKGLRLYLGGVLTGVFLSFMGYLSTLPDPAVPGQDAESTPQAEKVPKPRFEFFTLLPKQTLEVEEEKLEPAADVPKPPPATGTQERFLLQAGSFRQRDDAEQRRAQLILLGLEPKIEQSNGDNGRWFRVNLGPFASRASMSRARSLTANQNIETLVVKRSGP